MGSVPTEDSLTPAEEADRAQLRVVFDLWGQVGAISQQLSSFQEESLVFSEHLADLTQRVQLLQGLLLYLLLHSLRSHHFLQELD